MRPYGCPPHCWTPVNSVPPNRQLPCQLSQWWIRVGWISLVNERPQQSDLLKEIFETPHANPVCAGTQVFTRQWLSFKDPETGQPMPGVTGCWYCMTILTKIVPELKPHLITVGNGPTRNTCDLMPPSEMASKLVINLIYWMKQFHSGEISMEGVLRSIKIKGAENSKTIPPEDPGPIQGKFPQPTNTTPSVPTRWAPGQDSVSRLGQLHLQASRPANTPVSTQHLTNAMASTNLHDNSTNATGQQTSQSSHSTYEGPMGLAQIFKDYTSSPLRQPNQNQSAHGSSQSPIHAQATSDQHPTSGPMASAENCRQSTEQIVNRPGPSLSNAQAPQTNATPSTSQTSTSIAGCPKGNKAKMAWHFFVGTNATKYYPIACCTSCFASIIRPEIAAGKALATKWSEESREAEFFCLLWSPRLLATWAKALNDDNEAEWMNFMQARTEKQIALTKQLESLNSAKKIQEMQVNYNNQMAAMKMMAGASSLASAGSTLGGNGTYMVNARVSGSFSDDEAVLTSDDRLSRSSTRFRRRIS